MKVILNILLGIFLSMTIIGWIILFYRAVCTMPTHSDLVGATAGVTMVSFLTLVIKGARYDD
jgi:hypothetical protein